VKVNGQHTKVRQHELITVFTVGAGSAVFLRSVRVLPSHWHATRNLLVLEVSPALFQLVVSLDWYGLV
jgi:hypothetical protein